MQDSINHMPAHHPLVIWLYYFGLAKYDLAKFGSVMKQKGLIFINYVFGWWKLPQFILEKDEILQLDQKKLDLKKYLYSSFACHGVTKSSRICI